MHRRLQVLLCLVASCQAASFPDYPVKPISQYANVITKSGLSVSAIPMDDPQDQKKYFGVDLRYRNIVPVFVVIENHASDQSFIIRKDGLMYGSPTGGGPLLDRSETERNNKALAVLAWSPNIYGLVAANMREQSRERSQNILKKQLQSSTISPGKSASGFVFVPAQWRHSSRESVHLIVPFTSSENQEAVLAEFTF